MSAETLSYQGNPIKRSSRREPVVQLSVFRPDDAISYIMAGWDYTTPAKVPSLSNKMQAQAFSVAKQGL